MLKKLGMFLIIILICPLCLISCHNSNSPSTIQYNNQTLSYNTTKSNIEKLIGNGEQTKSLYPNTIDYDNAIQISYNDNKIRCIEINDSNITTYNNVKVGDSIIDVLKKYKYEQKSGSNYMIAFSNNNEVNITDNNSSIDFWILYSVNDNKISKITLYDATFAKTMK